MSKKVSYDAGHGINTSGKRTPDGEREWSFNNVVAIAFGKEMANYEGVSLKRHDDPTGKTDVSLTKRTNDANAWGADVYVSFHHNANTGKWGSWTGVQTHVYKSKPKGSTALAKLVQEANVKAYGLRDRGLIFNDLHITRETHCDAVLVEGGFMDSTIDIKKLRDDSVLIKAGKGIAQAVATHLGLKKKSAPAPTNKDTYVVVAGDTLWGISRDTGVTVANLKSFNGLKSDVISVGQVLKLKSTSTSTGIKEVGKVKVVNLNNFTYLYASTSDKSARVGEAHKGEVLPISGSVSGWYEVIYKGKRVYLKDKYGSRV